MHSALSRTTLATTYVQRNPLAVVSAFTQRTFRTSTPVSVIQDKDFPLNNTITPQFVNNRNPRNLEKLRIGNKPSGWWLEKPGRCFWNKVTIDITGRHITAKVQHFEGQTPVTASTKEWCIKKFLYSTKDASAVKAIGEVLARRCLESGITEVYSTYTEEDRRKEKINLFLTAMENGGVSLTEPDQIEMPFNLNYPRFPEKAWEIHEDMDLDPDYVVLQCMSNSGHCESKLFPKAYPGLRAYFLDLNVSSSGISESENLIAKLLSRFRETTVKVFLDVIQLRRRNWTISNLRHFCYEQSLFF